VWLGAEWTTAGPQAFNNKGTEKTGLISLPTETITLKITTYLGGDGDTHPRNKPLVGRGGMTTNSGYYSRRFTTKGGPTEEKDSHGKLDASPCRIELENLGEKSKRKERKTKQ